MPSYFHSIAFRVLKINRRKLKKVQAARRPKPKWERRPRTKPLIVGPVRSSNRPRNPPAFLLSTLLPVYQAQTRQSEEKRGRPKKSDSDPDYRHQHLSTKSPKKLQRHPDYRCDVCSERFKFEMILTQHLEEEHRRRFYCEICQHSFLYEVEFNEHSSTSQLTQLIKIENDPSVSSSDSKRFKCRLCSESFNSDCDLNVHFDASHLPHPSRPLLILPSSESAQSTSSTSEVEELPQSGSGTVHKYIYPLVHGYMCRICFKVVLTKWLLIGHYKWKHKLSYYCEDCLQSFVNKAEVDRHRSSMMEREYKGENVDSVLNQLKCKICLKYFRSECNVGIHMQFHLKEVGIQVLSGLNDLELDQKFIKGYKCDLCPGRFALESHFLDHRLLAHSDSKWRCSSKTLCSAFEFDNYLDLKAHMHSPYNECSFESFMCDLTVKMEAVKCDICFATFLTRKELSFHQTIANHLTSDSPSIKKISCATCKGERTKFKTRDYKAAIIHNSSIHGLPKVEVKKLRIIEC